MLALETSPKAEDDLLEIWLYGCVSFMGHRAKLPTRFWEDPKI